jgi:ADP-heptose:LPS heptosyltransferase
MKSWLKRASLKASLIVRNNKRASPLLRKFKAGIRGARLLPVERLVSLFPVSTRSDRVLIIRLDAIGDFVLWLDAARALATTYKTRGNTVILLANSAWADLANELQIFDEVIPLIGRKFYRNLIYRCTLAFRVRRLGCSIAIQPTYSREFYYDRSIIRTCGARERIGFTCDHYNTTPLQQRMSDRWYTKLVPASQAPMMELQRNAEFVRGFLGTDFEARLPDLRSHSSLHPAKAFWLEVDQSKPFYVLFPGATYSGRRWPVSSFRQVAERMYGEKGWQGVVCGGPADFDLGAELCQGKEIPIVNFVGRTSVSELVSIISYARLLLSNETSAIHIAAAVATPSICVLGGGLFGRFLPYQIEKQESTGVLRVVIHKMECFHCNWSCIYDVPKGSPVPCIARITTGDVWSAVETVLYKETHRTSRAQAERTMVLPVN